jgi:hypothetical protein
MDSGEESSYEAVEDKLKIRTIIPRRIGESGPDGTHLCKGSEIDLSLVLRATSSSSAST